MRHGCLRGHGLSQHRGFSLYLAGFLTVLPLGQEDGMLDWKQIPTLELLKEHKIYELLPSGSLDDRLEASGVCSKCGYFYVIFDNSPHIARLDRELTPGHPDNVLLRQRGESAGFEDLTYHEADRRFLIILEALIYDGHSYRPNIEEYDENFRFIASRWVDFTLEAENKGMEGLTYLQRNGADYILGLCEGNKCKSGKKGRKPGGGRIQVFQKGEEHWDPKGTIRLPKAVQFEDYASLDVENNRLAVVSQATSALWVGTFPEEGWDLIGDGMIYQFPKIDAGETVYCNIEGVAWMGPNQIVVVSDKRKPGEQPKLCQQKDQSIHIFTIPGMT
jgi:hypothetical protein